MEWRGGNHIVPTDFRDDLPEAEEERYCACVNCEQPFTDKNTHSAAGWRETQISGLCEDCFDQVTADLEDEQGEWFDDSQPF